MDRQVSVSAQQIEELANAVEQFEGLLSTGASHQSLADLCARLRKVTWQLQLVPLQAAAREFEAVALETATRLGKKVKWEWSSPSLEIGVAVRDVLKTVFLHAIRNALDHGIELPEQRLRSGKPEAGRIRVVAGIEFGKLRVVLTDDGRGPDLSRIEERLKRHQIQGVAPLEALFLPGFSTLDSATELSGRGVGLDAARAALEILGGEIRAFAVEPHGFGLELRVPLEILGTEVVALEIGDQVFWLESSSIERADHLHPEEDAQEALQLAQSLGLPRPPAPVFARLRGSEKQIAGVLAADRIGLPERRLFRRLDRVWMGTGAPSWPLLRAFQEACGESILACRMLTSGVRPGEQMGLLGDTALLTFFGRPEPKRLSGPVPKAAYEAGPEA